MQKSTYTQDVIFGLSAIGYVFLTVMAYVYANIPYLIGAAVCFVVFIWVLTKELKENARQLNSGEIKLNP